MQYYKFKIKFIKQIDDKIKKVTENHIIRCANFTDVETSIHKLFMNYDSLEVKEIKPINFDEIIYEDVSADVFWKLTTEICDEKPVKIITLINSEKLEDAIAFYNSRANKTMFEETLVKIERTNFLSVIENVDTVVEEITEVDTVLDEI